MASGRRRGARQAEARSQLLSGLSGRGLKGTGRCGHSLRPQDARYQARRRAFRRSGASRAASARSGSPAAGLVLESSDGSGDLVGRQQVHRRDVSGPDACRRLGTADPTVLHEGLLGHVGEARRAQLGRELVGIWEAREIDRREARQVRREVEAREVARARTSRCRASRAGSAPERPRGRRGRARRRGCARRGASMTASNHPSRKGSASAVATRNATRRRALRASAVDHRLRAVDAPGAHAVALGRRVREPAGAAADIEQAGRRGEPRRAGQLELLPPGRVVGAQLVVALGHAIEHRTLIGSPVIGCHLREVACDERARLVGIGRHARAGRSVHRPRTGREDRVRRSAPRRPRSRSRRAGRASSPPPPRRRRRTARRAPARTPRPTSADRDAICRSGSLTRPRPRRRPRASSTSSARSSRVSATSTRHGPSISGPAPSSSAASSRDSIPAARRTPRMSSASTGSAAMATVTSALTAGPPSERRRRHPVARPRDGLAEPPAARGAADRAPATG